MSSPALSKGRVPTVLKADLQGADQPYPECAIGLISGPAAADSEPYQRAINSTKSGIYLDLRQKLTRRMRFCPLSSMLTESSMHDSILPSTPRSSKRLFLLNVATKVYIALALSTENA